MSDNWVDGEILKFALVKDNISNIRWRTKDYRIIPVKDMDDKHLRNAALFLMGMGYSRCIADDKVRVAWLTVFRMEWERRLQVRQRVGMIQHVYVEKYAENDDIMDMMTVCGEEEDD